MSKITPAFVLLTLLIFAASVYAQSTEKPAAPPPSNPSLQAKETVSGMLLDADCKAADPTGKCEVAVNTRAFGVSLADGRYLIVDPDGNTKVKEALNGKSGAIHAALTGKVDGREIRVESVQLDAQPKSTQ